MDRAHRSYGIGLGDLPVVDHSYNGLDQYNW